MRRLLVGRSAIKPPKELAQLFADAPVARNENRDDYENLFAAIAAAAKPADAIAWMFVRDITDLSWEIRREKSLKSHIVKTAEQDVVQELLSPPRRVDGELINFFSGEDSPPAVLKARREARQWASGDPRVMKKVEAKLADNGDDASWLLFEGLESSREEIDAVDKRIATYELRRMTALRAIEHYSEKLARQLETTSSKIIDGEFTEAAE